MRKKTRRKKSGGVSCRICGKGGFANAASVYWHHVQDHGRKHGEAKTSNGLPSRAVRSQERSSTSRLSKEGYKLVLQSIPTSDLWAELGERLR